MVAEHVFSWRQGGWLRDMELENHLKPQIFDSFGGALARVVVRHAGLPWRATRAGAATLGCGGSGGHRGSLEPPGPYMDGRRRIVANMKVYFAQVMTTKGSSKIILKGEKRHNGAASWRALCRRCEPATAMRAQSIMQGILNVGSFPETLAMFEERHGQWGRNLTRCEAASREDIQHGSQEVGLPAERSQELEDASADEEQPVPRGAGGHDCAASPGQHSLRQQSPEPRSSTIAAGGQPKPNGGGRIDAERQGRQGQGQGQRKR